MTQCAASHVSFESPSGGAVVISCPDSMKRSRIIRELTVIGGRLAGPVMVGDGIFALVVRYQTVAQYERIALSWSTINTSLKDGFPDSKNYVK